MSKHFKALPQIHLNGVREINQFSPMPDKYHPAEVGEKLIFTRLSGTIGYLLFLC